MSRLHADESEDAVSAMRERSHMTKTRREESLDTPELVRELRRNQDSLSSVGLGVLCFGVWSVIKAAVLFVIQVPVQIEAVVEKPYMPATIAFAGAFLLLILAFILALRMYIWRSARAESQGGRHKRGYLFAVGLLIVLNLISLIGIILQTVLPGRFETDGLLTRCTIAFIEMTSLVTLAQMIAASIRVKRISRELEIRRS